MTFRMLLAVGLCTTLAIPQLAARDLSVVTRTPLHQAQDDAFFKPFTEATGTPLQVGDWPGGLGMLRSRIEGGSNDWDLVLVSGDELLAG